MLFSINRIAALAVIFLPAVFGAPAPLSDVRNAKIQSREVIEGSYIVVYKDGLSSSAIESHEASISTILSKRDTGGGIEATYNLTSFKGYNIKADSAAIAEIESSPEVAYVEQDTKVYASVLTTQTSATWGLGRISHRAAGSTSYIYDTSAGSGSTIYVVDTGILITHSEFGSRASWGANFVNSVNTDENGHGTHCAGTAAGTTYGVAKLANLVAVKVLDADGSGTTSGVISGIQWVANNAPASSVLSMSLSGSYSAALNSAVAATVSAGVTVAVAAGNDGALASNYSPASAASAITVGAIDSTDAKPSWSNYGSVLDVFAPGVSVLSAWIGSTTATNTISGTSMATPHVAGLAAYLIVLEGLSTPAAVASRIVALASSGYIPAPGSGSPNLIAYNGNGA